MPTYSAAEIEEIRAKAESERTPEEKKALAAADAKPPKEEHMIPQSRLNEVLETNRKLQERLDAMDAEQKKKADEALAKQGEWQTLAQQRQERIAELEGKVGTIQTYEGVLGKTLKAQMDSLSPEMQKLVPKSMSVAQQLDWLADNRSILTKQPAADLGFGKRGGRKVDTGKTEVDEAVASEAAKFGLSAEEYEHFNKQQAVQPFQKPDDTSSETEE
jgi:hypothetical protein